MVVQLYVAQFRDQGVVVEVMLVPGTGTAVADHAIAGGPEL
jgi:hypothetical protein